VYILPEFKSRKCSISFSRDYTSQGQKNKKALKIKAFRGYIFFIAIFMIKRDLKGHPMGGFSFCVILTK
jgi:hypothetical protein